LIRTRKYFVFAKDTDTTMSGVEEGR